MAVDMSELIARSSFGTPAALRMRARTPRAVTEEILAGLLENPTREELVARILEIERLPPTRERRFEWIRLHVVFKDVLDGG